LFFSNLPDRKTIKKGEICPKFIKMGIIIFTKSGKSGKNDKYIQKSYNGRMKYLLSHFRSIQNAFTNDIFDKYENSSRAEDVAAKAMSESQFITIDYLFEFSLLHSAALDNSCLLWWAIRLRPQIHVSSCIRLVQVAST